MRSRKEKVSLKKLAIVAVVSFALAILAMTGAYIYFFAQLDAEREIIEIPDFVGRRLESITDSDKIRTESKPIFSDDIPEGVIISQLPEAGARRKLGEGEKCKVTLTVSLGKEMQTVPSLQNYKYADAAAALRSIGAKIKIVSIYDDEKERDVVLRTSPAAGERIERGATVTLFVSRNHVRSSICVNDFVGMSREAAISEILAQGLTLGEIEEGFDESYPTGTVIAQSIMPGSYVLYGTKIDIKVNAEEPKEKNHPFRKDIIQKDDGELNGSVD